MTFVISMSKNHLLHLITWKVYVNSFFVTCFETFVAEAMYHQSCCNLFNTKYHNYVRDQAKKQTEKDCKVAVHHQALTCVLHYTEEHVIQVNEVVLISHLRNLYVNELDCISYPHPDCRCAKLKICLQEHEISQWIAFDIVNPGDKASGTYNLS